MSYGELDQLSGALAAWLQSLGLEQGARGRHHASEYPPVFSDHGLRFARRVHLRQTSTRSTRHRELEHQLKDSGASVIVILENFASTLAEVIDRTDLKHVVMASMGDLLGFWFGKWITFAVRHLAKNGSAVPSFLWSVICG